jgi:hypothetical protein
MSRTCQMMLFFVLAFLADGCKTAYLDTTWADDTGTWKAYFLNGVALQIPSELPQMKMNSNTWWFVIKARQADNFGYGVEQAVQVHCNAESPLSIKGIETRTFVRIEHNGGRTKEVQTPVNGVLYYQPCSFERPAGLKLNMAESVIDSSSFGYILTVRETNYVQITFIKNGHTRTTYNNWKPETEIFSDKERALIEKIVQSVR